MTNDVNIPRRHHYVPQFYLRGFIDPSSKLICVFDKQTRKSFVTGTKNAAVEIDFYEEAFFSGARDKATVERFFSEEVESPSNPAIERLRRREKPNEQDKAQLALYILSMIKRVPAGKERLQNALPKIAESVLQDVLQKLDSLASIVPTELLEKRRQEAREIVEWNKENPPMKALLPMPEYSRVIPVLTSMNWRFLIAPDNRYFLTCDNPVFFDRSTGIRSGDFTFPIASDLVLWGTLGSRAEDCSFHHAKSQNLKEVNRRTIFNATRFVFSPRNESWIQAILSRRRIPIKTRLDD